MYLIMVAQFRSFTDPFLILLAFPPGLVGVILRLWLTGTTLNVMSLMGVGDAGGPSPCLTAFSSSSLPII